jgi:hypothetical protein
MRHTCILEALCIAMLALGGCGKTSPAPPAPITRAVQTESGADTSVPAADAVFNAASKTRLDPAAGRSNSAMSQAQQSNAMPMPGQNNDHSAALAPAKRASGP